jgi:hypothetical protein
LLNLFGIPVHCCHKAVQAARALASWYRPTHSRQVPAAQVDHQAQYIRLKVPVLRLVLKRSAKRAQEIAQILVVLYNGLKHGPSGSLGLLFATQS